MCVCVCLCVRAGLNCALGPDQMKPFMTRLSNCADCFTHAYPNAGMPNAMGGYDLTGLAGQSNSFTGTKLPILTPKALLGTI